MDFWTVFWFLWGFCGALGYAMLTGSFKNDFEKLFQNDQYCPVGKIGVARFLRWLSLFVRIISFLSGPISMVLLLVILKFGSRPVDLKFALWIPKTFWDRYYTIKQS